MASLKVASVKIDGCSKSVGELAFVLVDSARRDQGSG